jgi:ABC-2 type transport system ATP-binding protein
MMGAALLEGVNLTVRFGRLLALRSFSLAVEPGQLVGLIGPNGSGKTTLLRTLCGLQRPHEGNVLVHSEPLDRNRDLYHHIGFTPDTPAVYEQLTLRDFLRFIGRGYDLPPQETEERIDFWLEQLWLSDKANEKIKALSRGMKQRIAIARTMMPNPSVVLLDEPAAGLDPAGRAQFRLFLNSLRQQGKAIIVSSHILADMDQYCSHIAIMSAGTLLKFDTVQAITAHHLGRRCRYTLRLVHPVANLYPQLAKIPDVDEVEVNGEEVTLEYSSERKEAAALLAHLVNLQLPIAAFSPADLDLEQAYLRTGIRQVD